MKFSIQLIALCFSVLAFAQNIPHATTTTVHIAGNCGMCEQTIEKAAYQEGVSILDWNKETKTATLTYDKTKTSPDKVLKKVADAGYDNEFHQADTKAYEKLHGCCQYPREKHMDSKNHKDMKSCDAEGCAHQKSMKHKQMRDGDSKSHGHRQHSHQK